jgi:hypothetical protein
MRTMKLILTGAYWAAAADGSVVVAVAAPSPFFDLWPGCQLFLGVIEAAPVEVQVLFSSSSSAAPILRHGVALPTALGRRPDDPEHEVDKVSGPGRALDTNLVAVVASDDLR